jgi:hypothetical protein
MAFLSRYATIKASGYTLRASYADCREYAACSIRDFAPER